MNTKTVTIVRKIYPASCPQDMQQFISPTELIAVVELDNSDDLGYSDRVASISIGKNSIYKNTGRREDCDSLVEVMSALGWNEFYYVDGLLNQRSDFGLIAQVRRDERNQNDPRRAPKN